ncbi:hypothetical protein PputUW4_00202 [Pseudomonas sp. UW4]|nr:hypothetical protein PputUW4_00202 [Pseudomonas sp. UW4]
MKLKLAFSPRFGAAQASCRSVRNCTIPVGASLLAKREYQSASTATDTSPSRAGSLPQETPTLRSQRRN